MNEIYLISSSSHRESINLEKYATTEDEIVKLVLENFKGWNLNEIIDSTTIKDNIVEINYYKEWDTEKKYLETKIYWLFKINKYE